MMCYTCVAWQEWYNIILLRNGEVGTNSKCRLGGTTWMANTIFLPLLEDIVSLKGVIFSILRNPDRPPSADYRLSFKAGVYWWSGISSVSILSLYLFPRHRQVAPTFNEKSHIIVSCKWQGKTLLLSCKSASKSPWLRTITAEKWI